MQGAVGGLHTEPVLIGQDRIQVHDTDYGWHTFTWVNTERNSWTIGTYRGAP